MPVKPPRGLKVARSGSSRVRSSNKSSAKHGTRSKSESSQVKGQPPRNSSAKPTLSLLDHALKYSAKGIPVLPLHGISPDGNCTCGKKECQSRGKHPRTPHGLKDATTDAKQIRNWWTVWPEANIGATTGPQSRLVVLDEDPRHGGDASLKALQQKYGVLPKTVEAKTGGGGRHLFFVYPDGDGKILNAAGLAGFEGIDVRGDGGYVVMPPSRHSSDNPYSWLVSLLDSTPAQLPPSYLSLLRKETKPTQPHAAPSGTPLIDGKRNHELTSLAGAMRRRGASEEEMEVALLTANSNRCQPPLSEDEVRKIAKSVARYDSNEEGGGEVGRDKSQAAELVALADEAELFVSPDGDAYATFQEDNHKATDRIKGSRFRRWLILKFEEVHGKPAGSQTLGAAIDLIEAHAHARHSVQQVYVRIAGVDGKVYVDLADADWRVVEISATGWRVIQGAPVKFIRVKGMTPLPVPHPGGKLDALRKFMNLPDEEHWKLVVAWLLMSLHPRGPYPVLIIHGEQGSSKSTLTKMIRDLVDPNVSPARSAPREMRDLMISANNAWLQCYDNMSGLREWLSDAFCRLATGGGFGTRTLYENREEELFQAARPILMNGIEELATRGDLLDRGILLWLPQIEEKDRRPDDELAEDFQAALPGILGALYDAVAAALKGQATVKLSSYPSMAQFAKWAIAAEQHLGWQLGSFQEAYEKNREAANELSLEATPISAALKEFITLKMGAWSGTATDLLGELNKQVAESVTRMRSWPGTPWKLSNVLRRLSPNLRRAGIQIEFDRKAGNQRERLIFLTKTPVPSKPSASAGSPATPISENPNKPGFLGAPTGKGATTPRSNGTRGQARKQEEGSAQYFDSMDGGQDHKRPDGSTKGRAKRQKPRRRG